MESKKETVKSSADREIVISRLIDAPREMVFNAFTTPEQMAKWWGPFGFTNPVCELDVRPGGKWRVEQQGPDKAIYKFYGVYKEVIKNERIVWTFTWEGGPKVETLGIFTFEDKDGKTLLTSTTVLTSASEREDMMKFGAKEGGSQSYERLEDLLTNNFKGRELSVTRILNAPREMVFDLWTKPEHIKHWWGPNGFTNTISKMDVREGGEWDFVMHGPDGTDYKNRHIFEEIDRPAKLVLHHVSGPNFRMIVTFLPVGDKTLLTIRSRFESAEQLQEVIKAFKADEGLIQNVERLEQYIATAPVKYDLLHAHTLMKAEPVIVERVYRAPVAKVWKALTNKDDVKQWYFDLPEFKPEIGFEFQFSGGKDGRVYLHFCKITEVVPLKKLTYSWRYDGYEGDSFATFELFAEGDNTRLKLSHVGLETFPASNPDFAKGNFVEGWTYILDTGLSNFVQNK